VVYGAGEATPLSLQLPGTFNVGNAVTAMAAAFLLGVPPQRSARALEGVSSVASRYAVFPYGTQRVRLLLGKNPAGWTALLPLLHDASSLLLLVNAREADGRDTSWLWDVPFEQIGGARVVASGERAADLGLRLEYAGIRHATEPEPLIGLGLLPPGEVTVVANYSAFQEFLHVMNGGPVR
jgi:UDP-N-acetylmuramyl tripeptide synthase